MAKKKKNKKRQSQVNVKSISPDALEKTALIKLHEKKYSSAIKSYKILLTYDREKYLSQLVECYMGKIRSFIEKKQYADLSPVIAQIKSLIPETDFLPFEAEIAFKCGDFNSAAELYAKTFAAQTGIKPSNLAFEAADAFVLSFSIPSVLKSTHPAAAEELASIHLALEEVCSEGFDKALDLTKKIGLGSMFSIWKLFIKGLAAFYRGDDKKADVAFGRIPDKSPIKKIIAPYLYLLPENSIIGKEKLKDKTMEKICLVAGYDNFSKILPRADYLWQVKRYRDSFQEVRKGIQGFPHNGPGVYGSLTRFYYNAALNIPEEKGIKYMSYITDLINRSSFNNECDEMLLRKSVCSFGDTHLMEPKSKVDIWEDFIEAYEKHKGSNNKLKSIVYFHLGNYFAQEQKSPFDGQFLLNRKTPKVILRHEKFAEQYLTQSFTYDINNRDAYVRLIDIYNKTGRKKDINSLVDKMVILFPNDKEIFLSAGLTCVQRNANDKGIKYLEKAFGLDPIDTVVKENLIIAYITGARKASQNGNINKVRDLFERAVIKGVRDADDFIKGVAYLYARWGILEYQNNCSAEGDKKFNLAIEKTDNSLPILYFALLMAVCYGIDSPDINGLDDRLKTELKKSENPEIACSLLKMFHYAKLIPAKKVKRLNAEKKRIKSFVKKTVNQPFSREMGIKIIELLLNDNFDAGTALIFARKGLRMYKKDPWFSYFKIKSEQFSKNCSFTDRYLSLLNDTLKIANEKGENELVKRLRQDIKEVETFLDLQDDYWDDDDDDDDDFDDDFDEEDLPDLSSREMDKMVNLFLEMLTGKKKRGKKSR